MHSSGRSTWVAPLNPGTIAVLCCHRKVRCVVLQRSRGPNRSRARRLRRRCSRGVMVRCGPGSAGRWHARVVADRRHADARGEHRSYRVGSGATSRTAKVTSVMRDHLAAFGYVIEEVVDVRARLLPAVEASPEIRSRQRTRSRRRSVPNSILAVGFRRRAPARSVPRCRRRACPPVGRRRGCRSTSRSSSDSVAPAGPG